MSDQEKSNKAFDTMFKIKPTEEAAQPPLPNQMTHVAVTTFQKSGKWYVAEFDVNPYTGQTGEMRTKEAGTSKDAGTEKFKIRVVELGIV